MNNYAFFFVSDAEQPHCASHAAPDPVKQGKHADPNVLRWIVSFILTTGKRSFSPLGASFLFSGCRKKDMVEEGVHLCPPERSGELTIFTLF